MVRRARSQLGSLRRAAAAFPGRVAIAAAVRRRWPQARDALVHGEVLEEHVVGDEMLPHRALFGFLPRPRNRGRPADAEGLQTKINDVFGTPFGGDIFKGWNEASIKLIAGPHEFEFVPGTRLLKEATWHLEDEHGGKWRQLFEAVGMPSVVQTMGYHPKLERRREFLHLSRLGGALDRMGRV